MKSALTLALLVFGVIPAEAHEAMSNAGPFVNGILHPIIVPAHLLILLALGLWIGGQKPSVVRAAIIAAAGALPASLIIGLSVPASPPASPLMTAVALAMGLLTALAWRAPHWMVAIVAVAAIFPIGFDGAAADWVSALGIWAGAMLVLLNIVNLAMRIEARWLRIGARVIGAWIAAIALMLLAFQLKA